MEDAMKHVVGTLTAAFLTIVIGAHPAFAVTWTLENFGVACLTVAPCSTAQTMTGQFDFNGSTFSNVDITSSETSITWITGDVLAASSNIGLQMQVALISPIPDEDFVTTLEMQFNGGIAPGLLENTEVTAFGTELVCLEVGQQCTLIGGDVFTGNVVPSSGSTCGPLSCVSTTPLPAALPLMATGLGLFGFIGRRRKKRNPVVAFAAA
jgi:hypothetical protein